MNNVDIGHLRTSIEVAQAARDHGNHPFGAILVDENDQVLLQAENTVVTGRDCTGHAETNLMRLASRDFRPRNWRCALFTQARSHVRCVRLQSIGGTSDEWCMRWAKLVCTGSSVPRQII